MLLRAPSAERASREGIFRKVLKIKGIIPTLVELTTQSTGVIGLRNIDSDLFRGSHRLQRT